MKYIIIPTFVACMGSALPCVAGQGAGVDAVGLRSEISANVVNIASVNDNQQSSGVSCQWQIMELPEIGKALVCIGE